MKKFNLKKVDKFQVMVSLNAHHAFKAAKSNKCLETFVAAMSK